MDNLKAGDSRRRRMPKGALMSGFEKPPPSVPTAGKGVVTHAASFIIYTSARLKSTGGRWGVTLASATTATAASPRPRSTAAPA